MLLFIILKLLSTRQSCDEHFNITVHESWLKTLKWLFPIIFMKYFISTPEAIHSTMIPPSDFRLASFFSFIIFSFGLFQPSRQNPRLPTIYWNASNPLFTTAQTSDTPPVIHVQFGESIDISCPLFTHDQTQRLEYYTLYQVTKEEFDSCLISKLNKKITKWIFDCKQPFHFNA